MAENVKNTETLADRLNDKLLTVRKPLFAALLAVLVVLLVLVGFVLVTEYNTKNGLAKIDQIYFSLTSGLSKTEEAPAASGDETTVEKEFLSNKESLQSLENVALEALAPYTAKSGIVGVRANLIVAEIYFQQNDFEKARAAWLKAAASKKAAYTAPLAYFNAAVSSENLQDNDSAARYYKLASEAKDFLLVDHALFSLGRISEAASNLAQAKEAYEKLCDTHPDSTWANLAKSRLLALETAGKLQ